jgi:hypothetical protein
MSAWRHCPHCLRGYTGDTCECAAVVPDFSACDVLAKRGDVRLSFHTTWRSACLEVRDDITDSVASAFLDPAALLALEMAARDYRERITDHYTENA